MKTIITIALASLIILSCKKTSTNPLDLIESRWTLDGTTYRTVTVVEIYHALFTATDSAQNLVQVSFGSSIKKGQYDVYPFSQQILPVDGCKLYFNTKYNAWGSSGKTGGIVNVDSVNKTLKITFNNIEAYSFFDSSNFSLTSGVIVKQ